jgi:hypothetical protein
MSRSTIGDHSSALETSGYLWRCCAVKRSKVLLELHKNTFLDVRFDCNSIVLDACSTSEIVL